MTTYCHAYCSLKGRPVPGRSPNPAIRSIAMSDRRLTTPADTRFDDEPNANDVLREKLIDALTPGYQAEFDPDEAERAGAFVEDALSERDAAESDIDLVDASVPDGDEG